MFKNESPFEKIKKEKKLTINFNINKNLVKIVIDNILIFKIKNFKI